MCIDSPKYLSKALGHDEADGTGLETLQQKKEMLAYLHRAWSGLTKFIQKQCSTNGKCVDFPLVGRFFNRNDNIAFIPHLDFISSGRYSFP